MKLDNSQLAAFSSVIREGSFEGAARKLHITASAISLRIKQLEDRLGQVLIMRGAPCKATRAGLTLLKFTEQIDFLESELNRDLGIFDNEHHTLTRLPIAVNADSLEVWFIDVMEFVQKQSHVIFEIRAEDQNHSQALLKDGNVVAAISVNPIAAPGCQVECLGLMRYIALASKTFEHKYFASGLNTVSLSTAPLLAFNQKDEIQHAFLKLLTNEALTPPVNHIPTSNAFLEAMARGLGWGMVPEILAAGLADARGLTNIAPEYYLDVPLHWHRWSFNSKNLDLLTVAVRKYSKKILIPFQT